jgi:hypothetical protein
MSDHPSLDKILETTLARVTEWLKFAETKNAALLAFCSAIVTTLSNRIGSIEYTEVRTGFHILLATSIYSGIVAVMSFLPILERAFCLLR